MEHDDDTRTSQQPGGGTDAEGSAEGAEGRYGSAGGPGHLAPGGGMTVGSGELELTDSTPPQPGEETADAATGGHRSPEGIGLIAAQDAASADVDESSTTGEGSEPAG